MNKEWCAIFTHCKYTVKGLGGPHTQINGALRTVRKQTINRTKDYVHLRTRLIVSVNKRVRIGLRG